MISADYEDKEGRGDGEGGEGQQGKGTIPAPLRGNVCEVEEHFFVSSGVCVCCVLRSISNCYYF